MSSRHRDERRDHRRDSRKRSRSRERDHHSSRSDRSSRSSEDGRHKRRRSSSRERRDEDHDRRDKRPKRESSELKQERAEADQSAMPELKAQQPIKQATGAQVPPPKPTLSFGMTVSEPPKPSRPDVFGAEAETNGGPASRSEDAANKPKPKLDVSSLLSSIKETKAALQEQQKKLKEKSAQKQLQDQQKRLIEQRKKEPTKSIADIQSKINAKLAQIRAEKEGLPADAYLEKKALPPPLILDAEGREIDQTGKVVSTGFKVTPVVSTMINKKLQREKVFKLEKPTIETDPAKNPYYDPRMRAPKAQRAARRTFKFVEAGTYMKKGQRLRTKLAKELLEASLSAGTDVMGEDPTASLARRESPMDIAQLATATLGDAAAAAAAGPNLAALSALKRAEEIIRKEQEPIPDVEWWDAVLLNDKTTYGEIVVVGGGSNAPQTQNRHEEEEGEAESRPDKGKEKKESGRGSNLNEKKITHLIEHPPILRPPTEKPPPGPMPLRLTKAEQKKLRRRTRAERHREQQERVMLGLEKPPPNKVKLSNMMRALGTEAVQDPTKIERMVREEMAQRLRNHEARNQARKLTPAQRRAKKIKKLTEDTALMSHVALFKVIYLGDTKHRYKVDINAQENRLSGCTMMLGTTNNLVLVEGGPKAIKRYKKLMLRRINWNKFLDPEEQLPNGEQDAAGKEKASTPSSSSSSSSAMDVERKPPVKDNKCWLVWEGCVLKPSFRAFRMEQAISDKLARKFLKDHNAAQYWDATKWFKPDWALSGLE